MEFLLEVDDLVLLVLRLLDEGSDVIAVVDEDVVVVIDIDVLDVEVRAELVFVEFGLEVLGLGRLFYFVFEFVVVDHRQSLLEGCRSISRIVREIAPPPVGTAGSGRKVGRDSGSPGDRWGHCLARPAPARVGYSSVLYWVSRAPPRSF